MPRCEGRSLPVQHNPLPRCFLSLMAHPWQSQSGVPLLLWPWRRLLHRYQWHPFSLPESRCSSTGLCHAWFWHPMLPGRLRAVLQNTTHLPVVEIHTLSLQSSSDSSGSPDALLSMQKDVHKRNIWKQIKLNIRLQDFWFYLVTLSYERKESLSFKRQTNPSSGMGVPFLQTGNDISSHLPDT